MKAVFIKLGVLLMVMFLMMSFGMLCFTLGSFFAEYVWIPLSKGLNLYPF